MWYVNASSFHTSTSTYFALINNFPGKENSTLDQQLIVADFSKDVSIVTPPVNIDKFIWSHPALASGPLIANDADNQFMIFLKSTTNADMWELWAVPYVTSSHPYLVMYYSGVEYFAAAGVRE
eukprot:gene32300-39882_t